jgi:D-glycero-D-manno-heptose 1,7-bisphosphate phosphatase
VSTRKAVFLDRDGTINEESGYLYRWEDCHFIPGAEEAVANLARAGFLVVVVTNQSGIARGYYTEDDLNSLHQYMERKIVAAGGRVDGWYYCPHHPEYTLHKSECNCRKPLPGMLKLAAEELGIDLAASWMIGDKMADIDAGIAAGCRAILVRTGYGETVSAPEGLAVSDNLLAAAAYIIRASSKTVEE